MLQARSNTYRAQSTITVPSLSPFSTARWACAVSDNADAAAVAELRALAQRFSDLVHDGTLLEQYEANIAFHVSMARLCANRELTGLILEFRGRGPSAPLEQWKTRARIEKSAEEHFGWSMRWRRAICRG